MRGRATGAAIGADVASLTVQKEETGQPVLDVHEWLRGVRYRLRSACPGAKWCPKGSCAEIEQKGNDSSNGDSLKTF